MCGDHVDFGQKVWWAQLKLSTGRLGWVKMATDDFEAIDLLAGKDGGLLGSVQFAGNGRTQRVSRGRCKALPHGPDAGSGMRHCCGCVPQEPQSYTCLTSLSASAAAARADTVQAP